MRVLVIEDDRELAEAIGVGLRREQLAVDVVFDGQAGLERALVTGYDVIVLDRDLPGRHGDDVCAELVEGGCRSRVLMLTAAATIEDLVDGLGLGADDYLPKPFAFAELVARIRALLRRAQPGLPPVLVSGDLELDPSRRHASRARPAARPWPQGVRRAGTAAVRPGPGGIGRGTPGAGLGRDGRPVHQHREGDHEQAAPQARRPAGHRDRGPGWIPDLSMPEPRPPAARRWPRLPRRTVRLKLTALYGGLFLVSTAVLLAVTYVFVANRLPVVTTAHGAGAQGFGFTEGSGVREICTVTGNGGLAPGPLSGCATLVQTINGQRTNTLRQLLTASGIALGIMAVVSVALGWLVAGRVLQPLRTITAAARRISASNLHQRLALDGPDDELTELGKTFDGLLARLDASFAAQRQFVANASHELRTPLARQRTLRRGRAARTRTPRSARCGPRASACWPPARSRNG